MLGKIYAFSYSSRLVNDFAFLAVFLFVQNFAKRSSFAKSI